MYIELLAPAASVELLDAVIGEGADAVYIGLESLKPNLKGSSFSFSQFEASLRSLRRMKKKLYVTVDSIFEQREADRIFQLLNYLNSAGPDAVIIQDLGVLAMLRSEFSALKIHASSRMNIASARACNALSRHGVSRAALARELSAEELRDIRAHSNMELELAVHGEACVSVSGLCLFSSFLGGKSANRGMCTSACGRLYHTSDTDSGYYFCAADLQLSEDLPEIAAAGINAVKIEGRMRNAAYAAMVVSAYRLVLDAIIDGNENNIRYSITEAQRILHSDPGRISKKSNKPVIAANARPGKKPPGFEKAPIPQITFKNSDRHKEKNAVFPDGLYVAVSSINDLYIVQSSRPVKVMLSLNRTNARYLLSEGKKPLPFKPDDIILVLDPFFPQSDNGQLEELIPELADWGYRQFVVNNLGHLSLFRALRAELKLIAGPWLYTFNAWALSFIASLGVDGLVSPLENNRQNLERTVSVLNSRSARSMIFVPVFAWPPLFRIRNEPKSLHDVKTFSDNLNEIFFINKNEEGLNVYPEKPFSITDKIPFLREAGYKRFVIDLSGRSLKKNDYKDLMQAVNNNTPLPRISRFNWKNGFYCDTPQYPS